jgi:hypothetical protein
VNQNVLTVHWRVDQIKSDQRDRGGVTGLHAAIFSPAHLDRHPPPAISR